MGRCHKHPQAGVGNWLKHQSGEADKDLQIKQTPKPGIVLWERAPLGRGVRMRSRTLRRQGEGLRSHLCHLGKEVKLFPSGEPVRPLRRAPPPPSSFSRTLGKLRDGCPKGIKGEGASPLLTLPTPRGAWPPPEITAGSKVFLLLSLLSFSSLSLTFRACKGKCFCKFVNLLYPVVLWNQTLCCWNLCQVNILFQPHCAKNNIMKLQSYLLLFHCHSK